MRKDDVDATVSGPSAAPDNLEFITRIAAALGSTGASLCESGTVGRMTWWGAMAWAEWLGNEGYGGASDWGLWSALNSDGSGPCGAAFNCTDSDLGHLFYTEGGLTAGQSITASTELNNHFRLFPREGCLVAANVGPGR